MRLLGQLARVRRVGHRRLLLLLSAALNIMFAVYFVAYVPIIRAQPICWDEESWSINSPVVEVDGDLAVPFMNYFDRTLTDWGVNHLRYGHRLYVTLSDWLDREWMYNMSNKALYRFLDEFLHIPAWDDAAMAAKFPDLLDRPHGGIPCEVIRKFTIEGGEWTYEGPKPAG